MRSSHRFDFDFSHSHFETWPLACSHNGKGDEDMKNLSLLILIALCASGCTSSTPDDSKAMGSNNNVPPVDDGGGTPPAPVATPTDCNQFSGVVNGKIRAIRDQWGTVNPNSVRVRLTQ